MDALPQSRQTISAFDVVLLVALSLRMLPQHRIASLIGFAYIPASLSAM